jgi:hypothetical protein
MKVVLWIVGILVGLIVIAGGLGYWWWQKNGAEMMEAANAAMMEGRKRGSALEESACLSEGLARHKADASPSIGGSIKNGLFIRGCLEASKKQPKFCESVPEKGNAVAVGAWAGQACAGAGANDPYCPSLMQQVIEYCGSPQRARKL